MADAAPAATDPVSLLPRLTTAMVARIQGRDDYEYRWTFTGPRKTGDAYRLGDFKAFIGQENHLRHEAFRNPAKIS